MVINLQMSIEHALKSFNVTLNEKTNFKCIVVELLHLHSQTIHSMKHVL